MDDESDDDLENAIGAMPNFVCPKRVDKYVAMCRMPGPPRRLLAHHLLHVLLDVEECRGGHQRLRAHSVSALIAKYGRDDDFANASEDAREEGPSGGGPARWCVEQMAGRSLDC